MSPTQTAMETLSRETITTQVRTLQIIVAALVMGCLTFAPIAIFLSSKPDPGAGEQAFPAVTAMSLAFGAVALAAQFVILPLVRKQARQSLSRQEGAGAGEAQQLLISFQTSTIIGAALAEGACFFNLIAHLIEGSPYTLVMAAILVLTIALRFPTVNGVSDWLEREIRLVKEERDMGPRESVR